MDTHKGSERRPNFERFFLDADTDKDGYLCFDELSSILKKYGYRCNDDEVRAFFKMTDTSGDDKISFEEYMTAMLGHTSEQLHSEATMRRVFALFDRDQNGVIDRNELRQAFAEMGRQLSEVELQRIVELSDRDGSETLDYEEFIAAARHGKFAV